MAHSKVTTNTTLLKLKGTPFGSAAEMKAAEEKILLEEWQNIERARVRRELFMKEGNRKIIAPFLNGFKANFVGEAGKTANLVKVYLSEDHSVLVDIDSELKSKSVGTQMEGLVKSLIGGFVGGYLSALGLREEFPMASVNPMGKKG